MPKLAGGWSHPQYWKSDGQATPEVPGGGESNYLRWQAVTQSLNSGFSGVWEPLVDLWLWVGAFLVGMVGMVAMARRTGSARLQHKAVMGRVVDLLSDPRYQEALTAVEDTSQTLGFKRPMAWAKLSQGLKEKHHWAEDSYRHLLACKLLEERCQGLSDTQRNAMVELAYQEFLANNSRPRGYRPTVTH